MAFNTAEGRAEYTATSGQTVFTFTFKIFTTSQIKVYQTASGATPNDTTDILTLTTDYTVTINGDNGGTVTLVSGATLNDSIVLSRELPVTRTYDYQQGGTLTEADLDGDQDYQTYLIQQLAQYKNRALFFPDTIADANTKLPTPDAGNYLRWNPTGTGLENDTTLPQYTTDAQTAATTATTQADIATTQAGIATTQAGNALTSANNADTSEANALASANLAEKWASEAEDVVVASGKYSAYHWAQKAYAFAISMINDATTTLTSTWSSTKIHTQLGTKQDTLVSGTNIKTVNSISLVGSGDVAVHIVGSKNYLINSNFEVAQRGTSISIVSFLQYTLDAWLEWSNGSTTGTKTVTQESCLGNEPFSSKKFLRVTNTALGTSETGFLVGQRIEDARTLQGRSVSFSCYVRASQNIAANGLAVGLGQNFNGGSTNTSTYFTLSANSLVANTWTKITGTLTIPSTYGKTINANSFLELDIILQNSSYSAGVTLDIDQVKLEDSSSPTPYVASGYSEELAACQRYLPCLLLSVSDRFPAIATNTTISDIMCNFIVTPRVPPTGITATGSFSIYNVVNGQQGTGSLTFTVAGNASALFKITTTAGSPTIAAGNALEFYSSDGSGKIFFTGCEL